MKKKAQLNLSFGWIFAIIVGATILVLAVYGATKAIKTSQKLDIAEAKEIGILLNPLETGFEEASSIPLLAANLETRIYTKCDNYGTFGKQKIGFSQKTFDRWPTSPQMIAFENKYLFSNRPYIQGKKFYVFSKPFNFPFKVADLMYLTSLDQQYCFENAPEEIEEDILTLNQPNLKSNCSDSKEDVIKICFSSTHDCDILVDYNFKKVTKNNQDLYFQTNALMYGAIFSDPQTYFCQVERLMKRAKELANLYKEKADLLSLENCETYLKTDLEIFLSRIEEVLENPKNIANLGNLVETMSEKNENAICKLW